MFSAVANAFLKRVAVPLALALCVTSSLTNGAQAKLLQGSVEHEDAYTRLARPNSQSGGTQDTGGDLRIQRPMTAPPNKVMQGLVDTGAFSQPLTGRATRDDGRLGVMQPAQFDNMPNSKFDLGADRGSRELTLAWEAWHHQLSHEVYRRWSDVATVPGAATLRLIVTRGRTITPVVVHSSGNPEFDQVLLATVMSLNGNAGLTFPSKSERQQVTFEADYVASTDIQPGFSWVKNDYEHIKKEY